MKVRNLILAFVAFAFTIVFTQCNEDDEPARPVPGLAFITDAGYTHTNTTSLAGETLKFGLQCEWNGTDYLRIINVSIASSDSTDAPFELINSFEIPINTSTWKQEFTTIKNTDSISVYEFELIDYNNQIKTLSLIITKKESGNAIKTMENVAIGVQENASIGSFYSLGSNKTYTQTAVESDNLQDTIDFLGTYEPDNELFLASPDANFKEYKTYDLSAWTTKNSTRFCQMKIAEQQFNNIDGDNYIIDAFDAFASDDRKKKAKNLEVNDIYVFKTGAGKYGIFRVESTTSSATGGMILEIKIQE